MASIYQINKGVNKPVVFKGLKAQYIWFMGGAIFMLLILYGVLYFIGMNQYLVIVVVLGIGSVVVLRIYRLNNTYGEHGLMKYMARKRIPRVLKCNSRRIFKYGKKV